MIKLKVIKAQNSDFLGEYCFHKNLIYIGSNHDADLYFPNTPLYFNHAFIEIVEEKLIIHIHQDVEFINVNNKRTTKFKTLTKNDRIEIFDICFIISDFSESKFQNRKEALNHAAQNIPTDKPELIPLISKLSQST